MQQKNVLFLHHVSEIRGAEGYLLSVLETLDKRYKKFLICQEPGPLTVAAQARGVTVACLKLRAWRKWKYRLLNLLTVKKITGYCRLNKIDIICSNCYRVTPYAVFAAKKLGIPCVTIIQDFVHEKTLKRFSAFQSDRLITVSESILNFIGGKSNLKADVVYNGIDAESFKSGACKDNAFRQDIGIPENAKIVGVIANIIPLKGHKTFIKAMKDVAKEVPEAVFVIAGGSLDKKKLSIEELQTYADELNIREKVYYLGYRQDIPNILSHFYVLVHPSTREAFGRVIIEAMSLSVPVVSTWCGGPSEIIEDGVSGRLVRTDNVKEMADAVIDLLKDHGKSMAMGKRGYEIVKEKFTPGKTVVKINDIFNELLGRA